MSVESSVTTSETAEIHRATQRPSMFPPTGNSELDAMLAKLWSFGDAPLVIVFEPNHGYINDEYVDYVKDGSMLGVGMTRSRTTQLFVHINGNSYETPDKYPVNRIVGALEAGVAVALTARESLEMPYGLYGRAHMIIRRHRVADRSSAPAGKRDVLFVDRANGMRHDSAIIVLE